MRVPRYRQLSQKLKRQILTGKYSDGDLLPSENELSNKHNITRATVRQALNELVKEGYITKRHGKGSIVVNRKKSLGLLNVKGFSDVVRGKQHEVKSQVLSNIEITWPQDFFYPLSEKERSGTCIFLKRLRFVEQDPVVLELTYLSGNKLPEFTRLPLINDSLFDTLQLRYQLEIISVEQDIRAVLAEPDTAHYLQLQKGNPILHMILKFSTSNPQVSVYSTLLCNTEKYSIGNIIDQ